MSEFVEGALKIDRLAKKFRERGNNKIAENAESVRDSCLRLDKLS